MTSQSKKFEIGIFLAALAALIAVWAINDYEDTWLYVTAIIIAIPTSWFYWSKQSKN